MPSVEGVPQEGEEDLEAETAMTLSGRVIQVDLEAATVVVEHLVDEETWTFGTSLLKVSETTTILKNDGLITLAEVKENDRVAVTYSIDVDGNKIVESMQIETEFEEEFDEEFEEGLEEEFDEELDEVNDEP